jgi:Arc/MetJ family transcription regulator
VITSVDLDEELFNKAFGLSPARTKKAFFEELMRTYVRLHEQAGVRSLRGRLLWQEEGETKREGRRAGRR